MPVTHHTITDHAGQRLDNFLLGHLKRVPKSRVYAMVRKGEVRVNGARARPHLRLKAGDVVRIPPYHAAAVQTGASSHVGARIAAILSVAVLYEDEHVIVLNKPAGIAVHGGSGVSFGVIEALRAEDPGATFELIHRLDRDTSGCLAVAKDRKTLLEQHRDFRDGAVKKTYDLIVHGRWPRRLRTVRSRLQRYTLSNGERRVRVREDGAAARTDFEIVDAGETATWLRAFARTGRTHQIRVHVAANGHAILGDDKYADRGPANLTAQRLMLHASALTLSFAGEKRRFEAPLDPSFSRTWDGTSARTT